MALETQKRVIELVLDILHATEIEPDISWLTPRCAQDYGKWWDLACSVYCEITDLRLSEMIEKQSKRERRKVDCITVVARSKARIVEVDERQHFNCYRAKTLRNYPADIPLAFDKSAWIAYSDQKLTLEGGGFGKAQTSLVSKRWRAPQATCIS
jgi:hypothetical protein